MKVIVNARLQSMAEVNSENATIIVEGTKIKAVGENLSIPNGAEVIDAKGCLVLPGFIDAHSHIGMWEEAVEFSGEDGNEMTDPITPQLRAIDAVYPLDPPFEAAYKSGVTAVATGPGSANVIGGQFCALKTYGKVVDEMLIKEPIAMKCAFGENPKRVYFEKGQTPMTRMGVAAKFREAMYLAKQYGEKKAKAKDDLDKMPAFDMKHEALLPVLNKELTLKVHAHRTDDILTAMRLAKEFDLNITLDHCTDGHLIAEEIAKSGFSAIVGPSMGFKTKSETKNLSFATVAALVEKGVTVAIMTDHPVHNQSDLPMFAALAVKQGLSREDALKAITINPAKILGLADRIGSISVGKDADIVIWDVDPLDINFKTKMVMINGEVVHSC